VEKTFSGSPGDMQQNAYSHNLSEHLKIYCRVKVTQ